MRPCFVRSSAIPCAAWMLPVQLLIVEAFRRTSTSFTARRGVASSPCCPRQHAAVTAFACGANTRCNGFPQRRRRHSSDPMHSILLHRGGGSCDSSAPAMHSSVFSPPMLEVEEKFDLMSSPSAVADVERRLSKAGFVRQYTVEMVDWYFDDALTYSLALNDCWLRYRLEQRLTKAGLNQAGADEKGCESASQGWQLKRGTATSKDRPSSSGASVYEETEGIQAVALACSLLVDPTSTTRRPFVPTAAAAAAIATAAMEFDNDSRYSIPAIPSIPQSFKSADGGAAFPPQAPPDLVPFARIVTHRSHWVRKDPPNAESPGRFAGLVVDMDATDFGHAVGEVEALVEAPSDAMHLGERDANHQDAVVAAQDAVVAAQRLIREFLRHVIYRDGEDDDDDDSGPEVESGNAMDEPLRIRAPAQGKLECYLEKFRPELYAALVEAGILRRPSVQACDRRGS
jgi:CYTH domain